MTRPRLLVPLAAAAAVLVLLGGVWWATSGSGEPSEANPGASTPVEQPVDGSPGDPGTDEPLEPQPTAPDPLEPSNPVAVAVDGYFPRSDDVLALNYSIGVPECYGTLGVPTVEETADAVVVTLERIVPTKSEDMSCIEIALMKSVDIRLDTPLGDRVVRDGSFGDKVVDIADAPYEGGDDY